MSRGIAILLKDNEVKIRLTFSKCIYMINTMADYDRYLEFEWDKGNIDKSFSKHKISPSQAEETFFDENLKILKDIKHSQKEKRFIALGKTFSNKKLFVVYTVRNEKIRIISARPMDKKERNYYEKT